MAIKTSNSGGEFQKCPEGMHASRCFKIIDCGTHVNPKFGKAQRKGWIFFELPNALMEPNDKNERHPFVVGKRYTLSHSETAHLRADLESWYGKTFNTKDLDQAGGFDLEKLLGRTAMINVVHSEDGKYANIKSINPMPQGMECPDQMNPSFVFSIEDVKDSAKMEKLSEKMKEFIMQSQEVVGKPKLATAAAGPDFDDDIPF